MQQGTDSYNDDIAVNLHIVSCEKVMKTLNSFVLVAKDPEYFFFVWKVSWSLSSSYLVKAGMQLY